MQELCSKATQGQAELTRGGEKGGKDLTQAARVQIHCKRFGGHWVGLGLDI